MAQTGFFRQFLRNAASKGLFVIQLGCMTYCFNKYIGSIVVCHGKSMEPTIHHSDVVLTSKLKMFNVNVERGDVVILKSPKKPHISLCKRVTGLEGDFIEPPDGYSHSYIPRGHVWVEGDNKDDSLDSRRFGPIPLGLVTAKVFYRVLPFKVFGRLPDDSSIDLS